MRPEQYRADGLAALLRRHKIASMPELRSALGTGVDITVLRKLKSLGYLTSYSHGGAYYTLSSTPQFDSLGLWTCKSVHFSRHGTLRSTLLVLVRQSEAGYTAMELESLVHVGVKAPLLDLSRGGHLLRNRLSGRYVYCSTDPAMQRGQLLARKLREEPLSVLAEDVSEELKAAVVLFFSLLDEKQRRLYAGLESMKFGHGGDCTIGKLLGIDAETVARGRHQLQARDVEIERIRKAGAGRKRVEKKRQK